MTTTSHSALGRVRGRRAQPPPSSSSRAEQRTGTVTLTSPHGAARTENLAVVLLLGVLLAAAGLAYLPFTQTPSVTPASASAEVFSAERAMADLEAVASSPRPMGSPEHGRTVAAIQARLAQLGVESQVVEGVATRNDYNQVFAGRLRNVIARIPGTGSTGAVAMLSHFDSLPTSMNANDGGLGVATLLETVRAIQAGPPLSNDLILWFGDADETTALNALLLQEHPWFRDVRFGFAFEAPGVHGPSVLSFAGQGDPGAESPLLSLGASEGLGGGSGIATDNGRWLREALDAVPGAVVALPVNDLGAGGSPDLVMSMWGTDIAGVSFGQIGDSSGYHTVLDRPGAVSPSSLQDSGDTALALARHFGGFDFRDAPDTGGLVAFTVAPGATAVYPAAAALPAGLVVLVALIAVVVIAKRRRRVTISGIVLGLGLTLVTLAVGGVTAALLTSIISPEAHFVRNPYGVGWRILLLSAVGLTVVGALFLTTTRLLRRDDRSAGLVLGPVVVVTLLAVLTAAAAPALSYVFLWPAAASVALAAWQLLRRRPGVRPWADAGGLAAAGAVVAVVAVPLIYVLSSAALLGEPTFAVLVTVFVALLGSLLVPQMRRLTGRRAWAVPTVLALLSLAFATGAQLGSGYDDTRPRPDYIQYTLDADSGRATWLSTGTDTDEWTEQFFPDGFTKDRRAFSPGYYFGQEFDVIEASAPPVRLAEPQLTVLDDTTVDGVRTVRLLLTSPRGAPTAHVDLELPGDLVAATVGGEVIKVDASASQRRLPLAAYNLGGDGMELSISVDSTDVITGTITDFSNGLPEISGMTVTDRPDDYMPAPFDFRDPTAVTTRVSF
jgi:hypothetical protein